MTCQHPATALYTWFARDDAQPTGRTLVIVCMACQKVLKGEAS